MSIKIYHNPRCSKSRQTLLLAQEHGVDIEIVEYLKKPPTKAELLTILSLLDFKPRELMRKGEAIYKELQLKDDTLSDEQLIDAMLENPILIERPIAVANGKAVIGRPPENIVSII